MVKLKYIIELELCDRNRNFGEILDGLKEFLTRRDGIDKAIIYEKKEIKNV